MFRGLLLSISKLKKAVFTLEYDLIEEILHQDILRPFLGSDINHVKFWLTPSIYTNFDKQTKQAKYKKSSWGFNAQFDPKGVKIEL